MTEEKVTETNQTRNQTEITGCAITGLEWQIL